MIVTVTLNPSLDRTLELERLARGGVLRTSAPTLEAGGKGVNVTRALTANGVASVAVLPVGGGEGAELAALLQAEGVAARLVPVGGRTRSNITLAEPDGVVTKLNEPGAPLQRAELESIVQVLRDAVGPADWVVISGSVPAGFDAAEARVLTSALDGARLAVDTSGEALPAFLDAAPRLVKPNRTELAELTGHPLGCMAEVIDAAQTLRDRGADLVLVSLGADGAVLVGPDGVLVGESRVARPRSTVGAGDCLLAGFLSRFARDESRLDEALLEGLAWGAAAAALPGTGVPAPADIARPDVQLVWQPDLDRPLVAS